MEISRAAIGVLAAACIAGGAGTAYYATRSQAPVAPAATAPAVSPEPIAAPVEQSEGLVNEPGSLPTAPPASPSVAAPAPARTKAPATVTPAPRRHNAEAPAPERQPTDTQTAVNVPPPVAATSRTPEAEPVRAPEPPEPTYLDLVVSQNSVIGLQVETPVTSERAKVEDTVVARVTRDVRVGDRVAIPAGSKAQGEVTLVDKGGRLKDRARLGVRFTSIVLVDGTRVPIDTETIYREGDSPTGESAAKIGGAAIGGAILGGILGGAKGAAIGTAIGGAGGSAAVVAGGRNAATLSAGSPVTIRLEEPATVTVPRD
jgi:type IV secretory pathway VirB10-like protein